MILLNRHSIDTTIEDRYASVVYSFDFENINKLGSNELKFEITIDTEAFISKFEANIDGELFIGKTKEKETASKEYSEAKEKDENAILISKPYDNIPNVFEIKTNIDSKSKISLNITIQQFIQKKFRFNQLNIQILRNFTKYNIIQNFEYISFKVDIKDKSGIYDINTDHNIIIDNEKLDKLKKHFVATAKITSKSTINEMVIKYKIKGEQTDSMILYDNKSHTFCHIISDIITDSMIQNEEDIDEGQNDDIDENILIPRRVVFVMDKSGSMSGSKWNKAISAIITAIKQLRKPYDRYCIVFFNTNIGMVPNDNIILATDDNINQTISYLQSMKPGGGTNINAPLIKAIDLIKTDVQLMNNNKEYVHNFFMNQIILITDGEPNAGERNTNTIISNVKDANDLKDIDKYMTKISIFSFGVGSDGNDSSWIKDLNHSFLKLLSVNNNGFYKRIKHSNTDTALMQYFDILSKPVLSNINIEYKNKNIKEITNTTFHTLYSGNDIIICGKMDSNHNDQKRMCLDLTITATTGKQQQLITKPIHICKDIKTNVYIKDNHNNIQRIWAYLKLQQFAEKKLIYNDLIEVSDDEKKNDDELPLSLAMKYKFVTPWTSMIVVKKKEGIPTPQPRPYPTPMDTTTTTSSDTKPPFVPQLHNAIDTANFDSIEAEQHIVSDSKTTDTSHFWGYTFKRPAAKRGTFMSARPTKPPVLGAAPISMQMNKTPSKETLEKVQAMKKQCESTISARLSSVNQRRLRSLRMQHKLKETEADESKKAELMKKFYGEKKRSLRHSRRKIGLKDFKMIKVIGKGAFSQISIVCSKEDNTMYAMKMMNKKDIINKNKENYVQAERDIMAVAESEWLVKLYFSFQDDMYLYLVMEYCAGGDLMGILLKEDVLTEKQTQFYMRELAAAINAVHELDFVHRDLKPDNILITESGHIKLCDFGLAKHFNTENDEIISQFQSKQDLLKDEAILTESKEKKHHRDRKLMYSTVGSPDYIAPEVFSQKGYDKMVDYWSMGIIMFECCFGFTPFYAEDPLQTCRKIVHYRKYFKIPNDSTLSKEGVDLLHCLICSHRRRYGFEQIKQHSFF